MIFSKIDTKDKCKSIYSENKIYPEYNTSMKYTWSHQGDTPEGVKLLKLYCADKDYLELLSEDKKQRYLYLSNKIKNTFKSYNFCGYNPRNYCLDEMIDPEIVSDYFNLKNEAMKAVLQNFPEPKNYSQLEKIDEIVNSIASKKINLDLSEVYRFSSDNRIKKIIKRYSSETAQVVYNMFGSTTGRLSTTPSSFPILNLKKQYRSMIKPQNDMFVEFDYNAFELRVLLALTGRQQPKEDMHDWNIKNIFHGTGTRSEAKQRIFAWLYNPNSEDYLLSREYDREGLLKKYFSDGKIINPFNREIEADDYHALNYLIQSTASDLFLEQVHKIYKILKKNKAESYISILIHDSMVLDFAKKDYRLLEKIKEEFKNTRFGEFKLNIQVGKDLGTMSDKWK